MNINKFQEIMRALPERGGLMQESSEWFGFMEFISSYFENRQIIRPLVVEIGIYRGAARAFYEQLLGAEYICIDINPDCHPDILGNSNNLETLDELRDRLDGREIDLLFIDGDHEYGAVKRDYDLYSPLTKHLVVLHDVIARRDGALTNIQVYRLWEEIMAMEDTIVFKGKGWIYPGNQTPLGIGVILKQGAGG